MQKLHLVKFQCSYNRVLMGVAVTAIVSLFPFAAIARNIGSVSVPRRRVELPRNGEVYFIPVLVESNFTGFKRVMKSGRIYVSARLSTGGRENIASWTAIVPVAATANPRDNWKAVVYFRLGCTPDGKVFSAEDKSRLYRRVETSIQFDQDPFVPPWTGMNIICSNSADLAGAEATFLIPVSAVDRLNLGDEERVLNGLGTSARLEESVRKSGLLLDVVRNMVEKKEISLEQIRDMIVYQKMSADEQQEFIGSLKISDQDKVRLMELLKAAPGS